MCMIFHNCPEIGRPAFSRVFPAGANCKKSCDKRLNNQTESQWRVHAAGDVGPYPQEGVEQLVKHDFSADGDQSLAANYARVNSGQHVLGITTSLNCSL